MRAEVRGGKLFIDLSEGDGFIQTILNGVRVESAFELGARWTPGEGVRFEGGTGIELVVPLHRSLGPVEIQRLYFLLGFAADPPITVGVAAAIGVQIGPFGMSVHKIGVDVPLRFPAERNGNLGALDLAFTFRPRLAPASSSTPRSWSVAASCVSIRRRKNTAGYCNSRLPRRSPSKRSAC